MTPLEGIKVLDLSRIFAAPWATQMLADLGADVIKVERPGSGDEMRTYGPPFLRDRAGADTKESPQYLAANRNKRSITIDFTKSEGQALIRALIAKTDVIVENYKVGDLKRYGLDYDSVRGINSGIIYCSLTGYGQSGPRAADGALDGLMQSFSGLMSITGDPDGPPQKVGSIVNDFSAGMYAAVGILAALRHRDTNKGGGQYLDLALLDASLALIAPMVMVYLATGEVPQRLGTVSYGSAPAECFKCSDGYLNVQAGGDEQFRRLCVVLQREDLLERADLATRSLRFQARPTLIPELTAIFQQDSVAHWAVVLREGGVLHAPVNTIDVALADAQVGHRGMVVETEHPLAGPLKLLANPLRFSETPIGRYDPPPHLGQHTDSILVSELGLQDAEIAALRSAGVI